MVFCFQLANNSDNLTFHPISRIYLKPVTRETWERKHWEDQVPYEVLQPCPHWRGRINLCLAPFDRLLFNYLFTQTLFQSCHKY